MSNDVNRPFLKWAGNKYRLAARIRALLPAGRRLIEPFVGSGALFLNSDYEEYLLGDSNGDLIALYQVLQEEGESFIKYARRLFTAANNDEARYYALRDTFNTVRDRRRRAALFIYLNRHGYNGLCRYNASGGFNVPFGRYARPYFPEAELRRFHERAQRATFVHSDFETVLAAVQPGDVVYCDPPYAPLSASANFTSYSAGGFDAAQQERLALLARAAADRGVPVLISNHDTPFTQGIYQSAEISNFKVQRTISCDIANRNKASELLALFL